MADHEDLIARAKRLARRADRAAADFERRLARIWREAERSYRALITRSADSATARIRAVQAAALRQQMRAVLRDSGFDALVDQATSEPMDALAAALVQGNRVTADVVGRPQIEALKALHRLDLLDEGDAVSRQLFDAVARGLYVKKPVDDILADLSDVLDRADHEIATLYDTSVSIFSRQVELLDAGDDPETRFLYAGPEDDVTRDFCRERVNQVFSREEIDAMDNGQLDNVLLTGGGYNCRHVWMQVSQVSALAA